MLMGIRPSRVRLGALIAFILVVVWYWSYLQQHPDDRVINRTNPEWKYPSRRSVEEAPGSGLLGFLEDEGPRLPFDIHFGSDPDTDEYGLADQLPLGLRPDLAADRETNEVSTGPTEGYFDLDDAMFECPDYTRYASTPHYPFSDGPLRLPFQRPALACRTFRSTAVEQVIAKFKAEITDLDLARLFENCFPNTLDTTIRWHSSASRPQTFIVTGDIDAEWLRDSHRQLGPYLSLAKADANIKTLIVGAINTHADYVSKQPYCNAFHPPPDSGIRVNPHNGRDAVWPPVDPKVVFECKYELDSLASFLGLSNDYFRATGDTSFVDAQWLKALENVLRVISEQSQPTYDEAGTGRANDPFYTFRRFTNVGTETLSLAGMGNPVNANTSLVRSAFRPSDDATIFQYFIRANAQMAVALKQASELVTAAGHADLSERLRTRGIAIEESIWQYGVFQHPKFGEVFAYEVDGYGGSVSMDDANIPSLLALPDMGFVDKKHPIYQNTRRMVLSKTGNPYYLQGKYFSGVGGPHVGINNAWPMSLLVAIRTSDNDDEIERLLDIIKGSTAGLGLMHESVHVDVPFSYTRPWFAWANSEFAKTILDIAQRKPYLIFDQEAPEVLL